MKEILNVEGYLIKGKHRAIGCKELQTVDLALHRIWILGHQLYLDVTLIVCAHNESLQFGK